MKAVKSIITAKVDMDENSLTFLRREASISRHWSRASVRYPWKYLLDIFCVILGSRNFPKQIKCTLTAARLDLNSWWTIKKLWYVSGNSRGALETNQRQNWFSTSVLSSVAVRGKTEFGSWQRTDIGWCFMCKSRFVSICVTKSPHRENFLRIQ